MHETANGSESSESIVNIPQSQSSGASSISTVSSTTTSSTTEKLSAEVEQLRKEKKELERRLRGLKELSDQVSKYRKENDQLKKELEIALGKKGSIPMSASENNPSVHSPFSLVSNQAAQFMQSPPYTEMNNLSLGDSRPRNSLMSTSSKEPVIAHPPVTGPPSSMQETAGPPSDHDQTKLINMSTPAGKGNKPAWVPRDSMPKQESLGPMSSHSSPEMLQLDSDKYEEATYEKVGLQLGRGLAGMTGSMYGASGGASATREETRPTDFPSLSSSLSNGMPQPPSHTSSTNPPYAMMHQSQMSDHLNSGLAAEVENITERLSSEPADSTPAIALQLHQITEHISKLEQKERDQKRLIDALLRENQNLKQQGKRSENSHLQELVALREQNTRLMQQMKSSRLRSEETVVVKSPSQSDWVHVERPLHMGDSQTNSDHSLVDRVRKLEQEKAELQRANANWKTQWERMEQKHQIQLSDMRARFEQDIAGLRARLAEQTSEYEARLLDVKRHTSEEESQKEEAVHRQQLAERSILELQEQLNEIRIQLSDTARDKQVLATELNILKAQRSGQDMQTSGAGGPSSSISNSALQCEIAMLKEQLKVFAEDFEHEREDRTMAQAARDKAKRDAEEMARRNQVLSSQIKAHQKQIKDRDDTIAYTLRQNEMFQQQVSDLKKKASAEWTEKQNLQHMLNLTQQQIQQQQIQQQQQMQRSMYAAPPQQNPYASAPPPRPFQQPTPPPPSWHRVNQNQGPEHLPGAWTCSACTYINYPGRTVCESCGLVNSPTRTYPEHGGYSSQDPYGSGPNLLMSRGNDQQGPGAGNGDLVVDSGVWHPPANI